MKIHIFENDVYKLIILLIIVIGLSFHHLFPKLRIGGTHYRYRLSPT